MPSREVKSDVKSKARTRLDEQMKEREAESGHSPKTAKRDGTATSNKTRRMKGT